MARLAAALAVVCLTACLLGAAAQSQSLEKITWNEFLQYICTNGFVVYPSYLCNPYTTTTAATTKTSTPIMPTAISSVTPTPSTAGAESGETPATTPLSGSALQRAHWCQLNNGSYLALGQTFLYNDCSVCQCIPSRAIRCANLECMTSYCIDGSTPSTRAGQCCQQCAYENTSTSCVVNGISFPTGTLLRQTTDSIQCWCQLGTVECRKSSASLLDSFDYFGSGTAVYVLVVVICVVLILGTLLCCAGGFCFYYYYYNNHQQTFQDAYAQYYSNAGWQPMGEDGQVVIDGVAQDKQAEAEQQQYEEQYPAEQAEEYVPPPYALYNGTPLQQQGESEQRFA